MILPPLLDPNHLFRVLLVSGSLGALIGLERQWDEQFRHHTHVLAGLRTFTLWALLGALCAWFSQTVHVLFFVIGFSAMALWIAIFLLRGNRRGSDPGFTTGAAAMLTFLIGGLVFWQMERVALVLTVSIMILLAMKPTLHSFTKGLSLEDVRSALKFAAVSGVILPLVPDKALGQAGLLAAINLHTIWLMVVLVSGVSFLGYIAVRGLGQQIGIAITGLLGGLVSSTATTLAMSRQSRERPLESRDCSLAILLACTIMNPRIALLICLVNPLILGSLWPSLLAVSLPGALWCLWRLMHGGSGCSTGECNTVGNPLRLHVALQFGLIYALIIVMVKESIAKVGNDGVLLVSGLSGLVDLDAITLSLSQMTGLGTLSTVTASQGILLAILANTLIKAGMAAGFGSPILRREVLAVLGITALAVYPAFLLVGHFPR
jgi:uncharacterized membrane protein (DUF4010 family)